jgi:UDP-2-acetamido-2,6-beta-L-arabino-hexul-4-ose reductase
MRQVLITGANGFIGRNLVARVERCENISLTQITRVDNLDSISKKLELADVVFHLAGVNRPIQEQEFQTGNYELTQFIVDQLESTKRPYRLIYASSTQAELENAYGKSKRGGEEAILKGVLNGCATIYRLPGVFGKWSKPNYNSVIATFCYNLSRQLPIQISSNDAKLRLVYIDDVVNSFLSDLDKPLASGFTVRSTIEPVHEITIGKIVELLNSFSENRKSLFLPHVGDEFEKALYSTWLSFLPTNSFSYPMNRKTDERGWLFEFIKTETAGQLFISTTLPGITRGNHFHHTKAEKFLVIKGKGRIQFRSIFGDEVVEYFVSGETPEAVDIPPGYTHNITNVGDEEMITLFWANEIFDQSKPDTYFLKV